MVKIDILSPFWDGAARIYTEEGYCVARQSRNYFRHFFPEAFAQRKKTCYVTIFTIHFFFLSDEI